MTKINVNLDEANKSRLSLRKYEKEYTEVPNSVLPKSYREPLAIIYSALTDGEPLPDDDCTFLVKADESGKMVKTYSPAIYRQGDNPVIKWGKSFLKLDINDGTIVAGKHKGKLSTEKIGKYLKPCLTFTVRSDGEVYSMPFPIHLEDWEAQKDSSELELLLEENAQSFLAEVRAAGSGSGSGTKRGQVVKCASLPLGEYRIVDYIPFDNKYGSQFMLHVVSDVELTLPTRVKNEETEEWEDAEVTFPAGEVFSAKATNRLAKLFLAQPKVTQENPIVLRITGEGDYNGYRTIEFEVVEESLEFENQEDLFLPF